MARSVLPEVTPLVNREKPFQSSPLVKKSQNPLVVVVVIAMVLFLIAGVSRMLFKPAEEPIVKVVVAIKDIPPGCKIGFTNLRYQTLPKAYMSANLLTSYPELIGKTTNSYIRAGEPVLEEQLISAKSGLSGVLFANQRAMTLKLEEDELVDHAISNGDVVDVIATTPGKDGKKFTRTICQSVTVLLSVPKDIVLSDKLKSFEEHKITLAVDPVDAEKLSQAIDSSKLRLVLRSASNHQKWPLPGSDERDLLPAAGLKIDPPKTSGKPELVAPPPLAPLTLPLLQNQPQLGDSLLPQSAQPAPTPLEWMVEVFSGSKKDTYAVPR